MWLCFVITRLYITKTSVCQSSCPRFTSHRVLTLKPRIYTDKWQTLLFETDSTNYYYDLLPSRGHHTGGLLVYKYLNPNINVKHYTWIVKIPADRCFFLVKLITATWRISSSHRLPFNVILKASSQERVSFL